MTRGAHPISEIKYNKYKERFIEQFGRDAYYAGERQQVTDATRILTQEFLECFNKYFEETIVEGITLGFNYTHRQTQSDAINGLVKVFGKLAENLDNGIFDARNQHTLKMVKNMYLAATNHKVIDYIENLKE